MDRKPEGGCKCDHYHRSSTPAPVRGADDVNAHFTLPAERLDRMRHLGNMSSRQEVVNEALNLLEAAIEHQNKGYATCFYKPNNSFFGGGKIISWVGSSWTKYKIKSS